MGVTQTPPDALTTRDTSQLPIRQPACKPILTRFFRHLVNQKHKNQVAVDGHAITASPSFLLRTRPTATSVSMNCGRRFFHAPRPMMHAAIGNRGLSPRWSEISVLTLARRMLNQDVCNFNSLLPWQAIRPLRAQAAAACTGAD